MGAIVGAHGKGSQIADIPGRGGQQSVPFRLRITGINSAGKDFLTNIVNLHFTPLKTSDAFPRSGFDSFGRLPPEAAQHIQYITENTGKSILILSDIFPVFL